MDSVFHFFARNFWLIALVMSVFNGFYYTLSSREKIKNDPSLINSYNKIFYGTVVFPGILWIVMGIGIIIGDVPSVFHFFKL